jgi:flagellar biosynthesis/type III secretory pathway protein FliH
MVVVREAHRMARAIIASAKAQARELEAEAREQGLRTGRTEALETEAHTLRHAAQALGSGAARLSALSVEAERELAESLPRLALRLARTILQAELTLNPEALTAVVRTAVRAVLPARQVVVTLHPDDGAAWERARTGLGDLLAGTEIRLETRESVERGYALVETEALTLDASLERQLQEAVRLLQEAP